MEKPCIIKVILFYLILYHCIVGATPLPRSSARTALYKINRELFQCLHGLIQTLGGLGEFSSVMQTHYLLH